MKGSEQQQRMDLPGGTVAQDVKQETSMEASLPHKKQEKENVLETQTLPQVSILVPPTSVSVPVVPPPCAQRMEMCTRTMEKPSYAATDVHTETQLQEASADTSSLPHSVAGMSQSDTQPTQEEKVKNEEHAVSCIDLNESSSPSVTRYTITSPSWLPSGWITEIQIRRTGSSAGTRDKYYKDLLTGRRFRSRNEVLNFLNTGKGRIKRRNRDKKALPAPPSLTVVPPMNGLAWRVDDLLQAHGPSACCQPWQPVDFLVSPYFSKQPASVGFCKPAEIQPVPMTKEVENVHKRPNDVSASTCSQPPSNTHASDCPQLLTVKKGLNVIMSSNEVDKQSFGAAQNPKLDSENAYSNSLSLEEPPAAVDDQRASVAEFGKGIEAAQKTVQLGREMKTSQEAVVRLSKELQETVHKLLIEIQAARRNLDLRSDRMGWSPNIQAAQQAIGSVVQATEMIDGVMGNIVHAQGKVDTGMRSIIQASEWLDAAITTVIKAPQMHHEETKASV